MEQAVRVCVNSTLDMMLAYYAAPTMLGIKPASLFYCANSERMNNQIDYFNNKASGKGYAIMRNNGRQKHSGLFVYHRLLELYINDAKRIEFLKQFGYNLSLTFEEKLENLKYRMETCAEFPHETGLFLGYPLHDISGFIENKGRNFILRGSWLVYSNIEYAKRTFFRYKLCRDWLVRSVLDGVSIYQIL